MIFMGVGGNFGNDTPNSFAQARLEMGETQMRRRDITDGRVLEGLERVPRHEFVPAEFRARAYEDAPLPIGEGQTISQPYIVAAMTAALRLQGNERVLEIGTGFGYQAAVLACLAREVFTVEFRAELATEAPGGLARLAFRSAHGSWGGGPWGWRGSAPCAASWGGGGGPSGPAPLGARLAEGGGRKWGRASRSAASVASSARNST